MPTMKTAIDLDGLRIEHQGGDVIMITSEAPTTILISDLIAELSSLQQTESAGAEITYSHSPQSPYNRRAGSYQKERPVQVQCHQKSS